MKDFAVIGLGRFGAAVVLKLMELKHDVLAVDKDLDMVQKMSEIVPNAVALDSTDIDSLRSIGINEFHTVIVAIGSDIRASILTTLLLKELGVRKVVAKAFDDLHGKILEKIGCDEIVYPERDMGIRTVTRLLTHSVSDILDVSPDFSITEMAIKSEFVGKSIRSLNFRNKYHLNILGVCKEGKGPFQFNPSADLVFAKGDVILVAGKAKDLEHYSEI